MSVLMALRGNEILGVAKKKNCDNEIAYKKHPGK